MITGLINSYKAISRLISALIIAVLQPVLAAESVQKLEIQNTNVSVQFESVDQVQAEQEKLKTLIENAPPAYQDKVMSAPELLEAITTEAEEVAEGFQSYFVETRANYTDSKTNESESRKTGDLGLRFEYLYETANFGDVKIQAQTSQQANNKQQAGLSFEQDDADTSITLLNSNLYLTPSLAADSALGDISSELTDALRRSSRFSLGVDTVRGARTRLRGEKFDLRLGSGELGDLRGSPYSGYQQTDGRLSWIGASHQLAEHFVIGAQVNQLDQFKKSELANQKVNSVALALSYDADDTNDNSVLP